MVAALGAGGVLATVLSGAGTVALAQPASARALITPPKNYALLLRPIPVNFPVPGGGGGGGGD